MIDTPSMRSTNLLVRKLECFHPLSRDDRELLENHCRPVREVQAKQDIICEGDKPENVYLVLSGFACRYKLVEGAGRQIMAYLVPGDFCDFNVFILKEMDHSIATLSRCQIVELPRQAVLELTERPAIAKAFWWSALVSEAVMREWIVNIGKRSAAVRIAHLLCELLLRLKVVGLVKGGSYTLPITQTDLADTMGLTVVHANRMLMSLRQEGMISINDREVVVNDFPRLAQFSGFDPKYLHLDNVSDLATF